LYDVLRSTVGSAIGDAPAGDDETQDCASHPAIIRCQAELGILYALVVTDPALAEAARSAIEGALEVASDARVVLIGDVAHAEAIDALEEATKNVGAHPVRMVLEELAPRPHRWLHPRIAEVLPDAHASVLLISFHANELPMRNEFVDLAAKHRLRHAHMVGVEREAMVAGLKVDPRVIERTMRALHTRIGPGSQVVVKSAAGTNLTVQLAPWCRWSLYGGVVRPGTKDNLPSGEIVTCPEQVEGTYVADGTLGDADGLLARSLEGTPIVLHIEKGRVQTLECPRDPDLARLVAEAIAEVPNLDRVGLVGFGLNAGIVRPFGNVFTDQKVPGVHISLGETFPARTGALWTASSWIAFTTASCDATVDRLPVLREGKFVL
jgi:leucyl aminopeptidase (aminopeptidase T)